MEALEVKQEALEDVQGMKWYAIRTYTGHEAKVKATIESEIKRYGLEAKVNKILIPEETVYEVRNGKRRQKVKNFIPGYIIIQANLDIESKETKKVIDVIVNIQSIVSFVGNKNHPAPLQRNEVARILGRVEERKDVTTVDTHFEVNDPVLVIDGPFSNFSGVVKEVNFEKQKLKVEVGILGRKTPVELEFCQVEIERHV